MTRKLINTLLIILIILASLSTAFVGKKLFQPEQKIQEPVNVNLDTSVQIAQTTTILRPSFIPLKTLQKHLKNTGLDGYASAFLEAERETGIGADWLVAIAQHESKNGTNYWWKYWNNCFSWGIMDKGQTQEAKWIRDNLTKWQALVYISKRFKALYLTKGGLYHKGNTLWDIGQYYASDGSWARKVEWWHSRIISTLPEGIIAKEWIMQTEILKGNEPEPIYYTKDYWTKPLTRKDLSKILYRLNGD